MGVPVLIILSFAFAVTAESVLFDAGHCRYVAGLCCCDSAARTLAGRSGGTGSNQAAVPRGMGLGLTARTRADRKLDELGT